MTTDAPAAAREVTSPAAASRDAVRPAVARPGALRLAARRWHELTAVGAPGAPAVTFGTRSLRYDELTAAVAGTAAGLRSIGVRPGERVAVYLDKRLETVIAMLAVSAADAVLVPINPVLRPAQAAHLLLDSGAVVVVTGPDRDRTLRARPGGLAGVRDVVLVGAGPATGDRSAADGPPRWSFDDLATTPVEGPADRTPGEGADRPGDPDAAIFYTSGSTGGPKGVVVGHGNLLAGAASVAGYLEHTADDVVLAVLPLSFDAGFSQLTTAFAVGAHVVLVNYLAPGEVVRLCAVHRVTALTCVPPLWWRLAEQDWPTAARGLRYFASTGGRMPEPVLQRLRRIFPTARPYLMYGLTEAFRSTYLEPAAVDRRRGSIGQAVPSAEVHVVRPDGSRCDPGEPGELVHAGPLVTRGYWNDPARTAERFRPFPPPDGPLAVWSGDTVVRDDDGYLYFVGRTDDLIKTSGYRVSPSEIEDAAYATGLVGEALAFGTADEQLGERIVLAVAGRGDAPCDTAALTLALRRDLPAFQVPRLVVDLGSLPRSPNGKLDRGAVRRQVRDGAG